MSDKNHNLTHVRIYSTDSMVAAYDANIDADTLARRIFDLIAELREDTEPAIRVDGWYTTDVYVTNSNKQTDAGME